MQGTNFKMNLLKKNQVIQEFQEELFYDISRKDIFRKIFPRMVYFRNGTFPKKLILLYFPVDSFTTTA